VSGRFYASSLPAIHGIEGCRLSAGSLRPVWAEARLPINAVAGLMGALALSFPPGAMDETWLDEFFG
jgi:hypothetical protein